MMAYHGFVEQDGKYAILMDERDVKALVGILGSHSGVPDGGEYRVLEGMWEAFKPFQNRDHRPMRSRNPVAHGEAIHNWYYKET